MNQESGKKRPPFHPSEVKVLSGWMRQKSAPGRHKAYEGGPEADNCYICPGGRRGTAVPMPWGTSQLTGN